MMSLGRLQNATYSLSFDNRECLFRANLMMLLVSHSPYQCASVTCLVSSVECFLTRQPSNEVQTYTVKLKLENFSNRN